MKDKIISAIKIGLPLGVGFYLIWHFVDGLEPKDKEEIGHAFGIAEYGWILFSLVFAMLSHLSRAYRWKYTLKPLGYKPKFLNMFFSVMIAYFVNLFVPRLGELTRCGIMTRYEGIPFDKALGTVIAERIADMVMLLIITAVIFYIQFSVIESMLVEMMANISDKVSPTLIIGLFGAAGIGGIALLVLLFNKNVKHPLILKIRSFVQGIIEGVKSILSMEDKWAFIFHTFFIWFMYVVMFYVCFFSLPETSTVPIGGIVTAFVLGGFTIVLINGGIGAYPLVIQAVLLLYGIDENTGAAFGWIVWTIQTLLLLVVGAISYPAIAMFNKNRKVQTA